MTLYSNNGKFSSGRKPKRNRWNIVLAIILSVMVLVFGAAGVFLLHNHSSESDFQKMAEQVRVAATAAPTTAPDATSATETAETAGDETIEPTQPNEFAVASINETRPILPQYVDLHAQNSDLYGWITIPDTKIDYPVMFTPGEPEKYLHTGFDGNNSYPGVPFIDINCQPDSTNLLIYAHNMPNGTMFRSLIKYQEKNYWEKHPTIRFNTLYEEQEFEVLAAFYDRVYRTTETDVFKFYYFIDPETEEAFNEGITQFKEKALYDTGVEASYGDKLITLVTCAYHTDHGRFVVVARKK